MDQLLRLLTLQDSNTRVVLLGASLLGLASAVLGTFAVLRRRSLVGDAIAHAALPGICVAYFVVGDRNFAAFLLGALVFGVLGVGCITLIRSYTRIKEDAAIGIVLATFFGLGIVLSRVVQNQPSGNRAGLDGFIFGKAASMVRQDAAFIAGIAGAAILLILSLFKEFKLLCFDREFAASGGWPVTALDLVLMAAICLCTVVGLPAVGVVLMAALLIIPAAAARFWTERLGLMLLIAGGIGMLSALVGTALSAVLPAPASALSRGWPTGPLIALVAAACFLVSMLLAPARGIAAGALRRLALRGSIARQHLLRSAYELLEEKGDFTAAWRADRLWFSRSASTPWLWITLWRARLSGLIRPASDALQLTERGLQEAFRAVRAHRLWELFLIEQADIAPDHVHRDADELEHFLPKDLLAQLEKRLLAQGRLPASVPRSPHEPVNGGVA